MVQRPKTAVLSIGTSAGADYYTEQQAEYYLGGAEPTGHWWNRPGHFGLADRTEIDPAHFQDLHAGFSPRDKRPLAHNSGSDKRRCGYDLTFSADKSISAMWAVATPEMRAEIEAAQEAAARAGLDLMQEKAGMTRRGKGGTVREPVQMFGATFQHGDTRAGDPEIHTHAVIFNVARRDDGTWGTLTNEQLFKWKMAAGAVYRAELASQLHERLGVEIEQHGDRHEFIRVKGVSEEICGEWSKRRADIKAAAKEKGFVTAEDTAWAAAIAIASRGKKQGQEGREERWKAEATAQGWDAEKVTALTGKEAGIDPVAERNKSWRRCVDNISAVISHESIFTEQKLWQVTAEAAAGGFPAKDIAGLVNRLEADGVVIRLPEDESGQTNFSTRAAIEDEIAVRAMTRAAAKADGLHCTPEQAEDAIRSSDKKLSAEQATGAIHLMTSPGAVALLEGAPGVGKSTLLKPVVVGFRAAGAEQIIATSVGWRQARDLGGDIEADATLATDVLLRQYRDGDIRIEETTVIIVDELGQWSARQARALLEMQAETGCKIVGVGDRRQLQAVGASPGMRLMTDEVEVATVDTIIRQDDEAARAAVRSIMDGDAAAAIKAHREHGQIVEANGHAATIVAASEAYQEIRASGKTTAIIAQSWTEVRELSTVIRDQRRAAGDLTGDDMTLKVAGNTNNRPVNLKVAVGEEIRFRLRNEKLGVINGTMGKVVALNGQKMTVEFADKRRVVVDPEAYKDKAGHCPIVHGYATTLAAAQGITVDKPVLFGSTQFTRNAATVGLSRGRDWTTVVIDRAAIEEAIRARRPSEEAQAPVTTEQVDEALGKAWARDGQKIAAIDYLDSQAVEEMIKAWDGHLSREAVTTTQPPPTPTAVPIRQPMAEKPEEKPKYERSGRQQRFANRFNEKVQPSVVEPLAGTPALDSVQGLRSGSLARPSSQHDQTVAESILPSDAGNQLRQQQPNGASGLRRAGPVEPPTFEADFDIPACDDEQDFDDWRRHMDAAEEVEEAATAIPERPEQAIDYPPLEADFDIPACDDELDDAEEAETIPERPNETPAKPMVQQESKQPIPAPSAPQAHSAAPKAEGPAQQAVKKAAPKPVEQPKKPSLVDRWLAEISAALAAAAAERAAQQAKEREKQARIAIRRAAIEKRETAAGLTSWYAGKNGCREAQTGSLVVVIKESSWWLWRGAKTLIESGIAKGPLGAREQAITAIERVQALDAKAMEEAAIARGAEMALKEEIARQAGIQAAEATWERVVQHAKTEGIRRYQGDDYRLERDWILSAEDRQWLGERDPQSLQTRLQELFRVQEESKRAEAARQQEIVRLEAVRWSQLSTVQRVAELKVRHIAAVESGSFERHAIYRQMTDEVSRITPRELLAASPKDRQLANEAISGIEEEKNAQSNDYGMSM